MRGKIDIEGTTVDVDFYPSSLARNRHQPPKEVNLVQDWMCDKVKHFMLKFSLTKRIIYHSVNSKILLVERNVTNATIRETLTAKSFIIARLL